jgi:hypothetical protein
MTTPERTYFWDFFGPRSVPTAQHFRRHLHGFLARHGLSTLATTEDSESPMHAAVGLCTPSEHWELIEKALRPKRYT